MNIRKRQRLRSQLRVCCDAKRLRITSSLQTDFSQQLFDVPFRGIAVSCHVYSELHLVSGHVLNEEIHEDEISSESHIINRLWCPYHFPHEGLPSSVDSMNSGTKDEKNVRDFGFDCHIIVVASNF